MVVLWDWDEAGAVESPAVGVDGLVEFEDPTEAQPGSNGSIMAASNHLIAPDLAESRITPSARSGCAFKPAHGLTLKFSVTKLDRQCKLNLRHANRLPACKGAALPHLTQTALSDPRRASVDRDDARAAMLADCSCDLGPFAARRTSARSRARDHRGRACVDSVDDLSGVDAAEIHGGDREISVPS